jgi:hypothetical protein
MSRERDHTEQISQEKGMLRERDAKRKGLQKKTGSRESVGVKVVKKSMSRKLTPTGTLGTMWSRLPIGSPFL